MKALMEKVITDSGDYWLANAQIGRNCDGTGFLSGGEKLWELTGLCPLVGDAAVAVSLGAALFMPGKGDFRARFSL